jgi:signal transduction histidine kinase
MTRKILAIEDDQDALANLCDILELDGHTVVGVGTLAAAVRRGPWADYSVVLLDRKLPDGTADDILPQIRAAAPRTSILMITGYADLESTIAALRSGASDYLLKPVNPDLVRAAVERALRMHDMEDKLVDAERLAAVGQMMTVLTHESGNVLARGNVALEALELELADSPAALELVARAKKANTDLRRLHEEVRSYAAPIRLERECWDLGGIWRQTWKNLLAAKKFEHLPTLVEHVAGADLKCDVDSFRLDQVFRNLFENAIAACRDASRIELTCAAGEFAGRDAVSITVRDNGPGLTPDQAERVFLPFYTTKPKGTGLGLAIVTRIIEAHGGNIRVASEPGSGATFTITLPRRAELAFGAMTAEPAMKDTHV